MEHLTDYQKNVIEECLKKGNGGISLPMGSGKTLLSICLALKQLRSGRILAIVPKTLVVTWKQEIEKFFGNTLKYQVYINDIELQDDTKLVISTPDMIAKHYKNEDIINLFTYQKRVEIKYDRLWKDVPKLILNQVYYTAYKKPKAPLLTEGSLFFKIKWDVLLIDEIQKMTKISSQRAQGLAAICAIHRWGLSGTIFDEPNYERILGYHLILNIRDFPRTLPEAIEYVHSDNFKGLNNTLVYREKNEMITTDIKLNKILIEHTFTNDECRIYTLMKNTLNELNFQALSNNYDIKFRSGILSMISYLRQSIVCPVIPLTTIMLNILNINNDEKPLCDLFKYQMKKVNLESYLNDENSLESSRIKKVIEILKSKHSNPKELQTESRIEESKEESKDELLDSKPEESKDCKKTVIFSSFRMCLDMLSYFIKKQLPELNVYSLEPSSSINKRTNVLNEFEKSDNGVLLLTYDIGAEGLNLQYAQNVIILDFWWNANKTKQSIARVFRFGQTKEVNVYYLTANTGIEKALFTKQQDKLTIIDELLVGKKNTSMTSMKIKDIIDMINANENYQLMANIY